MHIDKQIMIEVNEFYKYVSSVLYNQAVQSYIYATKNDFPFHALRRLWNILLLIMITVFWAIIMINMNILVEPMEWPWEA